MAKSLYTAAQRREAKEKGQPLVTIDMPGFRFQGLLKPGKAKDLLQHAIAEMTANKDTDEKLKELGLADTFTCEEEDDAPAGAVAAASA